MKNIKLFKLWDNKDLTIWRWIKGGITLPYSFDMTKRWETIFKDNECECLETNAKKPKKSNKI